MGGVWGGLHTCTCMTDIKKLVFDPFYGPAASGDAAGLATTALSTMPGYLYRTGAPFDVQLIIFGKDGTLLDSEAVRLPALKECTAAIAHTAGEPALLPALLKAGGSWEKEH